MIFFEDVQPGTVRETGSKTVTAEEIIAFAREFDPQYFHLDAVAAKDSIFGGLVASGWHTASMAMRLMVDSFVGTAASIGSPGFDDLRWRVPVRPGDTLRVRSTVLDKAPSQRRPDIGSVRFTTECLNQRDEVVMSLTSIALYRRRPA
ncbi:MaoC family dehydratase [Desertibaculum subflavum]|uniref:MaoC family dehydratase n=1 Tax=Desertibaculum subflavum TaxID=2268458 RepID=UPI000E671897